MDAASLCLDIIDRILQVVEKVKANSHKCRTLAQRLDRIKVRLEAWNVKFNHAVEKHKAAFEELRGVLDRALDLVSQYTASNWVRKVLEKDTQAEAFADIHTRLTECERHLTLDVTLGNADAQLSRDNQLDEADLKNFLSQFERLKQKQEEHHAAVMHCLQLRYEVTSVCAQQLQRGDVQIGDEIGRGALGVVHAGSWLGASVAIKQTISINLTEEEHRKFIDEINLCATLHHANVAHVFGACWDQQPYLMVMERLPEDLHALLRRAPDMPLPVKVKLMLDVALGMRYLHSKHVVHCDLKSMNVLVNADVQPVMAKIGDLGVAQLKKSDCAKTTFGCVAGSPRWMAPELLQPEARFTYKADVYSFGMLCYEIMSAQLPFAYCAHQWAVLDEIKSGQRPSLPECPEELKELITECWSADADGRPHFVEICSRLDAVLCGIKPAAAVSTATQYSAGSPLLDGGHSAQEQDSAESSASALHIHAQALSTDGAASGNSYSMFRSERRQDQLCRPAAVPESETADYNDAEQDVATLLARLSCTNGHEQEALDALIALRRLLCRGDVGVQDNITQGDGFETLVPLLAERSSGQVKEAVVTVLLLLVLDGTDSNAEKVLQSTGIAAGDALLPILAVGSAERRERLAAAGGVPLLVALLQAQEAAQCRQQAALALATLAWGSDERRDRIVAAGALAPLVALLQAQEAAQCREWAARALATLALGTNELRDRIVAAGALAPLVALLQAQCREEAARALANLAVGTNELRDRIVAAGALAPLVALLQAQEAAQCREEAARALANLACGSDERRKRIVAAGALAPLVALLQAQEAAQCRKEAAHALAWCSRDDTICDRVVAAGAVAPLVAARAEGLECAGVALRKLAALDRQTKQEIKRLAGVRSVDKL